MPAEERCEVLLVKFDLKFGISDVQYLAKVGGKIFRPARKAPNILGRISAKFSETSFQISRLFLFFLKLRSAEGRC